MRPLIRRNRRTRRGVAVVETAIVAPLVVLGMLGMMEVSYAFMIRQTVTLASREGARVASLPSATVSDVTTAVDATMTAANLSGYTTTTNLAALAPADTTVSVTVTLPFDRAGFTGQLLGGGILNLTATTTMRLETAS